MRIVVFSSNSKSANAGLKDLIGKRNKEIVALVIVTQLKGSLFKKISSFNKYLKRTSPIFLLYKIYEGLGGSEVINSAKKYGIPIIKTNDINDTRLLEKIKALKPDLSLCFFANQILKKPIISAAKLGTLNIHGSILPKYKGAAQYFWYLYNNDKKGGVTIHYMDEKLDTGDMISQETFTIKKSDSMYELHMKIGKIGAKLYDKLIDPFKSKKIKRIPQRKDKGSYLTLPTRKEMKVFRKKGLNIF
jgi:methionyl-tRNA formyltransferase|tara:strand:- start:3124 stop:3861 length:738 start_codon:yes stop_codon:yes gene_type:complete